LIYTLVVCIWSGELSTERPNPGFHYKELAVGTLAECR
jgi:hypothetical protein